MAAASLKGWNLRLEWRSRSGFLWRTVREEASVMMTSERIAQLRAQAGLKSGTHGWADTVLEEVLAEVERLRSTGRSVAALLRLAADQTDCGRPWHSGLLRQAADVLDEVDLQPARR
ncbi:hypothetical protein [Streptomyces sp. NPDC048527]|uniref:hypothetical protein n=1 Tax=Streptomyces sp. NPDC048527 TaxID=3365568 RepID=UPI00371876D9